MAENEFANKFGNITGDRLTYYVYKGWFSSGARQDIPLKHITSVRHEISRSIIGGIVLILIGIPTLTVIIGIPILFLGVLLLWGSPTISVNTAGNDHTTSKGWPWDRSKAQKFVDELRNKLFKE